MKLEPATFGRRSFLALAAASVAGAQSRGPATVFAPQHFLDRATELDLYRLTDPQFDSRLPQGDLRFISHRTRFLIFSRLAANSAPAQIFRFDLRSGETRQLAEAQSLDPATPGLSSDDRSIYFFDGPVLKQLNVSGGRDREISRVADGWERSPGFSIALDGSAAIWIEKQQTRSRFRSANFESPPFAGIIDAPVIRPRRRELAYRLNDALHLAAFDGSHPTELPIPRQGTPGQALWSPDGETLFYLWIPREPKRLIELRAIAPGAPADQLIAKTSQYAAFGVNADASVFVGATRSAASPYVLLLLRANQRELTLCEHRSADPYTVRPTFAPDSQSIFFEATRNGRSAIYRMLVERFVEETGSEPS